MEARVEYRAGSERPRLTVVRDDGESARYSALPHVVMRRADLAPAARLLYAILQGYAWQGGECRASHETMAAELGCSTRMLRTYLTALIDAGLVTEHDAGIRRQKTYRLVSIGTVLPIETPSNEKPISDYTDANRKFPTVQSEISDTFNRKPASDSKKKTPEKKTLEEEVLEEPVSGVVVGAERATTTMSQADILKGLSPEAVELLAWWRQCHGKKRPPNLNPTQARLLEAALADLGLDRLKEAVQYMAGKGVSEIDKARTAAYTKRQIDEDAGGHSPSPPHVNGTAAVLTPATDEDRALWGRALDGLRPTMGAGNFEQCLAPLTVLGRAEDGGLCLLAPSEIGERLRGFRFHVIRALEDAGDQNPAAVKFKARKPKGRSDAE